MENTVGKTIESILNQDYPNKEIIIIDGGSNDNTVEILKRYPIALFTENIGISNARNLGYKQSNGEFIAFTDADCELETQWTRKILAEFSNEKVGLVGGRTIYKTDDNFCSIYRYIEFLKRFDNLKNRSVVWAAGSGLMFRKSVLDEIGGFKSDWVYGEDTEISYMTNELGYEVRNKNNAIAFHMPENNFRRLVKHRYQDSRAHVRVFKSHSKTYLRSRFITSWFFPYDMLILPILYAFILISSLFLPISSLFIYFLTTPEIKALYFGLILPIWIWIITSIMIFLCIYGLIPTFQVLFYSKKKKVKNFIGALILHHARGFAMGLGLIVGTIKLLFKK